MESVLGLPMAMGASGARTETTMTRLVAVYNLSLGPPPE